MVRDAMMSFVSAGRDTTASMLSWFLYCMYTHPLEQEKVYQELIKLEDNVTCASTLSSSDRMGNCDALATNDGNVSESNVDGSEMHGTMQHINSRKMRKFIDKVLNYDLRP